VRTITITVDEAARNLAGCVDRAHRENVSFVLLEEGLPVARLVPPEKVCTGKDLAEALAKVELSTDEAADWSRELRDARSRIRSSF